jgi:hypothetical protein
VQLEDASTVFDLRARTRGVTVHVGMADFLGSRRYDELRASLRPLSFGAAYKVLDLLVEHVLRANGNTAQRLWFSDRRAALNSRPTKLPTPLDAYPDIGDRVAALYVELEDARHAVTHRRAPANADGDLDIYDRGAQLTDTLTGAEIHAFVATVHGVAEAVIEAEDDERRVKIIGAYLNALASRHRLSAVEAIDPGAATRLLRIDVTPLSDSLVSLDLARIRETVAGQTPSFWNIEVYGDDGRVFVGRWDDVPNRDEADMVEFHPDALPAWLTEELWSDQ